MGADSSSSTQSLPQAYWGAAFKTTWQWLRSAVVHRRVRRLRISETLSLGERRFVAILEFDGQEFLLAGCANSLELLARLEGEKITEIAPRRERTATQAY